MNNKKTPVIIITYIYDEKTGKLTMIVKKIYLQLVSIGSFECFFRWVFLK